jgi:hypothetical protein
MIYLAEEMYVGRENAAEVAGAAAGDLLPAGQPPVALVEADHHQPLPQVPAPQPPPAEAAAWLARRAPPRRCCCSRKAGGAAEER